MRCSFSCASKMWVKMALAWTSVDIMWVLSVLPLCKASTLATWPNESPIALARGSLLSPPRPPLSSLPMERGGGRDRLDAMLDESSDGV